ncbi:5'/3'-nucleotidase SurE [Paraurantiacibacter namhicola]|uniref:5'-nucleotidase SurE n=1 Tax=Paraurantiacibacter namhicola TaxID=645517 RepID=A0A1C7DB86_9SPHN|nr:5'/3'-nucleotidase SurE [Paraurantiacibacter namhicola]ANU08718.1 5'-nucleotidase SurE [Paraurantiacibacter namhicola]
MRILLTNDDGIHAPGLALLEEIAREFSDDVWTCAPAEEQSGAGHSLTLHSPVRLRKHGDQRYAVTGTPSDAVNLAMRKFFTETKPDLVLSGINHGENLADDITYSGTASAAMEAALAGVPAIAMSQALRESGLGFDAAKGWAVRVLQKLIDVRMARRSLVNVNFPACATADVRGIRVTRQGFHDYARGSLVESSDPRGRPYYWFGLYDVEHTLDHGTDLEAVNEGYVSVTPLQLDLTLHSAIGDLAERFSAEEPAS